MSKIPTTVRSSQVALELITLLHDHSSKAGVSQPEREHLMVLARNVCIDRCAEAEETCPCDTWGVPLAERSEIMTKEIEICQGNEIAASVRVDITVPFRVGDHIRLVSASPPENMPFRRPRVLDGLIQGYGLGSMKISLMEPPPPEECSWYIFQAGNNTTTNSMLETIGSLARKGAERCPIYSLLFTGEVHTPSPDKGDSRTMDDLDLNASQSHAVLESTKKDLTLIWGPPGTGKTTTIVHIIDEWRTLIGDKDRILVAASTNNAVDNVLEKYVTGRSAAPEDIVRVCPDSALLSKSIVRYWVGAFVDGDFNKPSPAMRAAQKRSLKLRSYSQHVAVHR